MELTFILKKIVSEFIMPLPIGIILAIIALVYLYKNKYFISKIFLSISIVWIFLFSYAPFANMLLSPLENSYKKLLSIPKNVKYIVYLGGDQQARGWEVLRLYNKINNVKIITSGYQGRGNIPEAIKTANILKDIGIKSEDIIIHKKPQDTYQEALKIKEFLKDEKFILVTSAYHIKRAMMTFKKVGLSPIAAPSDFLIKDKDKALSLPRAYHLYKSKRAWHEYIGILWLKLKNNLP